MLKDFFTYIYDKVPYYKKVFDDFKIDPSTITSANDIRRLPVLTKNEVQQDTESFLSADYLKYPGMQRLSYQRTSGSSGQILKIYWSNEDYIKSMFELWTLRKKLYGITPSMKYCSFGSTININNRVEDISKPMLLFSGRLLYLGKNNINNNYYKECYDEIIKFQPSWMLAQPSTAYHLADYISKNSLEVPRSLKYIELTGEYLFPHYRQKISEVYKVPVANMYGATEVNGIAFECPEGNMHCLNNVFVEVLKDGKHVDEGEEGEIHVTSFTNKTMPFVRYALGDRGVIHSSRKCKCGNKNPYLEIRAGRTYENIFLDKNTQINSYILINIISSVNKIVGYPVNQFQVVQENYNEFYFYIVLNYSYRNWEEAIKKEFIKQIHKYGLGKAIWEFKFCETILNNPQTGKLQFFVNNIDKNVKG